MPRGSGLAAGLALGFLGSIGAQLFLVFPPWAGVAWLGTWALAVVQFWRGPVPFPIPLPPGNPIEEYVARVEGWLLFSIYAAVVGPLIEELAFRGWIQRSVQKRYGNVAGVGTAAVLLAGFHLWYAEPAVLIVPFVLAITWGVAALVTDSVITAIVLHGMWNALLMVLQAIDVDPDLLFFGNLERVGAGAPVLMISSSGWCLAS